MAMKWWQNTAIFLLGLGGLNWGLTKIFNFNLVDAIVGSSSILSWLVYLLVGVSGVYSLYWLFFGKKR